MTNMETKVDKKSDTPVPTPTVDPAVQALLEYKEQVTAMALAAIISKTPLNVGSEADQEFLKRVEESCIAATLYAETLIQVQEKRNHLRDIETQKQEMEKLKKQFIEEKM